MPQAEFIGHGSIRYTQRIIDDLNVKRILLVTGRNSFKDSGADGLLKPYFNNVLLARFNDFDLNPKIEDVISGVKLIKDFNPDLIIAVGGGSVIDIAKLINIISANNDKNPIEIINNGSFIKNKGIPLVVVPTTAGTGSEATHFAVVYFNDVKYSLAHKFVLPDFVILEPSLSYSASQYIKAISGLDALCQAIESYWAVGSNIDSQKYALESIQMILTSIELAVCSDNSKAKDTMVIASNLAGKAINISKTTAPHAISYPLTTYFGIPHGHAVSILLGSFFVINYDLSDAQISNNADKDGLLLKMEKIFDVMQCSGPLHCKNKWYSLLDTLGVEYRLSLFGVDSDEAIGVILDGVSTERISNNPVAINHDQIKNLIKSLM